jgi:hypothetical protein
VELINFYLSRNFLVSIEANEGEQIMREVKPNLRQASDVKPGDVMMGVFKGFRTFKKAQLDGTEKDAYVYTFGEPQNVGQVHDLWGSNAAMSSACRELRAGELVLIVHRGLVKRQTKYGVKDVNDCCVTVLDDSDMTKVAPVLKMDGVRVTTSPAVLAALGIPPLK